MQVFDEEMVAGLIEQAKASPRGRANINIHDGADDPVQRLFIAMEPGSYVRPHIHSQQGKWEFFTVVRGQVAALFFDEDGMVRKRLTLTPDKGVFGFEIPPNTWHTVTALTSGTVFLEAKQGPYIPLTEESFASWSPKEGEDGCKEMVEWLATASEGETPPSVS